MPAVSIGERLSSIPGVRSLGAGRFHFGEEDEDGVMSIRLASAGEVLETIEVSIPRVWVKERGPRVFALVFMLQGWTQWEVFDPQIDDILEREAVLQGLVTVRQAQMEKEGGRVPKLRLEEDPAATSSKKKRWRWW